MCGASVKAQLRHHPYGSERWTEGEAQTDFDFTGQRKAGFGLLDYNARYYDPVLGRFISADTVVPSAYNPQAWNRYSYTANNPLKYTDPSGHCFGIALGLDTVACIAVGTAFAVTVGTTAMLHHHYFSGPYAEQNRDATWDAVVDIGELVITQSEPEKKKEPIKIGWDIYDDDNDRVIVELGSGDFSNFLTIAGENPNDKVIGLEGDPDNYALGMMSGNIPTAVTLFGAEARQFDFSNGLPNDIQADEIYAISPTPSGTTSFLRAIEDINPGGRIFMQIAEEFLANQVASDLETMFGISVPVTEGPERYPSFFTHEYDGPYFIDVNVP